MLLLHVRVRTSVKLRALCSREIDLADLHSLRSYSKYLTSRHLHILCPSSALDEVPQILSCFTFEGLSGTNKVVQLANQTYLVGY
jgi:hypothetical protein